MTKQTPSHTQKIRQNQMTTKAKKTLTNVYEILEIYSEYVYEESDQCGHCVGCSCQNSEYEKARKIDFGKFWKIEICSGCFVNYPEYLVSNGGTCYKPSISKIAAWDKRDGMPIYKQIKSLPDNIKPIKY